MITIVSLSIELLSIDCPTATRDPDSEPFLLLLKKGPEFLTMSEQHIASLSV